MNTIDVFTFISKRTLTAALLTAVMLIAAGCVLADPDADATPGVPVLQPAPVIAISPGEGVPGTTISVSGAGWPQDDPIFIDLVATQNGSALRDTVTVVSADDEGRFNTAFPYPQEEPWASQSDVLVVASGTENDIRASAPFSLTISQAITPTGTVTGTQSTTATPGATATAGTTATAGVTAAATTTPTATPTVAAVTPTSYATAAATATRPAVTSTAYPTRMVTPVTPQPLDPSVAYVTSGGLNVRTGPSVDYPVIVAVPNGTALTVVGQNSDGSWLYVRLNDGTEGWVSRAYTNYTGTAPVLPTPTATTTPPAVTTTATPVASDGWSANYYSNSTLSGIPAVVRVDTAIDFNWGSGSPAPGIPSDNFSARWTRTLSLSQGLYRFYARSDDGVRVWLDGELIIDQWRDMSATTYTVERSLSEGYHSFIVEYYEDKEYAEISFWWERVGDFPEWRGEYYNNRNLVAPAALVRNDSAIDFNFGTGSPAPEVASDNFSVRWTRNLYFDSGTYRFHATVDDGVRVYVDNHLVIDQFNEGSQREFTGDIYLNSGNHLVRVEYFEGTGGASIHFWWERISTHDDDDDDFDDWKGEYWDNRDFAGDPEVTRDDKNVFFNWGSGSPDDDIPSDNFSARWTQEIDFPNGLYRFYARSSDGIRFYVDDILVLDEWHFSTGSEVYTVDLILDDDHDLRVEYFERIGNAFVEFTWQQIVATPPSTSTPTPSPTPTVDVPTETPTPIISPTPVAPTITPTPTVADVAFTMVQPASGAASTAVTISGDNFPANTTVNVYLGALFGTRASSAEPEADVYATGTTDADGTFSIPFTIPDQWNDGRPILAGNLVILVASEDFESQATAVFDYQRLPLTATITSTVAPTGTVTATPTGPTATPTPRAYATVVPAAGTADTPVIVTGAGFPANTPLSVYLGIFEGLINPSDFAVSVATGDSNASGAYELSFLMPSEWPNGDPIETGRVAVIVATEGFGQTASALFQYTAPDPTGEAADTSGSGVDSSEAGSSGAADEPEIEAGSLLRSLRDGLQRQQQGEDAVTDEPTVRPTSTRLVIPTATSTPAPTATPTSTPLATATPVPATAVPAPVATATPVPAVVTEESDNGTGDGAGPPAETATVVPTDAATDAATAVPTAAATDTPAPAPTAVPTEPAPVPALPSIVVRPGSGAAGSQVLVTTRDFPANVGVAVDLRLEETGAAYSTYAAGTANDRGVFRVTFALPAEWTSGQVSITVRAVDGSAQSVTGFTIE